MPGFTSRSQDFPGSPAVHPVLYVDDEPVLLDVCKQYFDARGGEIAITGVESASRAIELLKTTPFEVIISDYQMPGMTGIDLLKHLQQQSDTTPFILFTGQGREEIVIEAINNGATYYLQKGGTPRVLFTELEHKIREAIRRQSAEKALIESEIRYRAVFENSGTAIIIIEDDMTISLCNDEFLRMTGLLRADVEGRIPLTEFIHPDDLGEVITRHELRRSNRDLGVQQFEARITGRTGSVRSVSIKSDTIPGTHKTVASLIDITERKHLEEELRRRDDEIRILYSCYSADSRVCSIPPPPVTSKDENIPEGRKTTGELLITARKAPLAFHVGDMTLPPPKG